MRLVNFAQMMFFRRHTGYPVVGDDGRLLGFARLQDAREASTTATVASIMVPADTIPEEADAMEALTRIAQGDLGRLAVVDAGGRLVGMLSKTDLVRRIEERTGPGRWPRAGSGPDGGARPQAG